MSLDKEMFAPDEVETFVASSLREALKQIRAKLGPDALIISQRKMGSRFAVDACLELPPSTQTVFIDPVLEDALEQPRLQQSDIIDSPVSLEAVPEVAPTAVAKPLLDVAMSTQPGEQRTGKETQIKRKQQWEIGPVDAQLEALGYSRAQIRDFPGCHNVDEFRLALSARLNYAHVPMPNLVGCFRFVGAPGTGKSTMIIKVLARWVQRHSTRDVVVVSTDQEHLAGAEALSLACQMMNVTLLECAPHELGDIISTHGRKALVLVDTPAMIAGHMPPSITEVKDVWVCSALHSAHNLIAQHHQLQSLRPVGIVLTQLDQNNASDELASLIYQWRLPLYFLSTGSTLPGSIEVADAQVTHAHLFKTDAQTLLQVSA